MPQLCVTSDNNYSAEITEADQRSVSVIGFKIIRVFSLIFCCLAITASFAQIRSYQGTVLNRSDSTVLPFVHVHIENLSIGVVTNSAGQFHFIFHDTLSARNIVFSCIGFKNLKIPIPELSISERFDTVFLEPDILMLDEVVVEALKQDTLSGFIEKVIEKIKANYPTDKYFLFGFYRQIAQNGDSSSRLIEAAISIYDPGYSGKDDKVRIKINQLRKSDDYIEYSWTKSLAQLFFGSENDLVTTYHGDFLRQSGNLINGKSIFNYELKIDTVFGTGENRIAKIAFHSIEPSVGPYFVGEIYVSLSDFAIRRMTYSWIVNPKFTFPNQELVFFNGYCRFKKVVEYHKIGAKYYPFLISTFEPISGVTGSKGRLQYKESTILINEVLLNKSDYDKIKAREKERSDADVYERDFPYDEKFWAEYNMTILNPIDENQRFSLERKESLKSQFQKNARRKKGF